MTTITQNVTDIAGAGDDTSWTFYTEQIRQYGAAIISTKKVRKYPVAGVLTVVLDPGPAVVVAPDGKHYPFTVPNTNSDLWSLIAAGVAFPGSTPADAVAAAVNAYLAGTSYDVLREYANLAAFPVTGAVRTIYVALDTGTFYRWSGSAYITIGGGGGGGLSLTDDGTGLFTIAAGGTATLTDDGTGLFTIGA